MPAALHMTPVPWRGYQQVVSITEGYPGRVWLGVAAMPVDRAGGEASALAVLSAADCRRLAVHLNIAAAALEAGAADKSTESTGGTHG